MYNIFYPVIVKEFVFFSHSRRLGRTTRRREQSIKPSKGPLRLLKLCAPKASPYPCDMDSEMSSLNISPGQKRTISL